VADRATMPADLAGTDVDWETWRVTTASLVRMVMALGLPDADPRPVVAALSRQLPTVEPFDVQEVVRPVEVPASVGRLLYNGVAVTAALGQAHRDLVAVPVLTRLVLRMFDIDQVTITPGQHLRVAVRDSHLPDRGWRRRQFEQASDELTQAQFDTVAGQLIDDTEAANGQASQRFVLVPLPQADEPLEEDPARPTTVFISYAHDSPAHKDQVRRLAELLRDSGVEVVLDQWVPPGRQDWGTWAIRAIVRCDFTIIIDELHGDRPRWKRKLLPVVLPGHTKAEIPYFMQPHSADRYHVESLDAKGISDLMAALNAGTGPADPSFVPAAPAGEGELAAGTGEVPRPAGTTTMTATSSGRDGRIFQAGRDQHITGA
jgi:hypothetical protein